MVAITVRKLFFKVGAKEILQDISHTFTPGQFTAIMGKNGSGKTSLLRCLNLQYQNFEGNILIGNQSIHKLRKTDIAKLCAFVPQGQELIYNSNVFETVLTGRLPHILWKPSDEDIEICAQILRKLDLENLSAESIQHLSGGERQKVFIARALAQQTPIILLDEPITYLDMKHQLEIMLMLKQLSEEGYNIIMVVHDINLALAFCDNFLFLKNGSIVRHCPKDEINSKLLEEIFEVSLQAQIHNGLLSFSYSPELNKNIPSSQ